MPMEGESGAAEERHNVYRQDTVCRDCFLILTVGPRRTTANREERRRMRRVNSERVVGVSDCTETRQEKKDEETETLCSTESEARDYSIYAMGMRDKMRQEGRKDVEKRTDDCEES